MLLGLAGYKGSGKSTAASHLEMERDFVRLPMAAVLKGMMSAFGLTDRQIYGDLKEVTDEDILCGKTPRHAMQTLGTEWGRYLIGDDVWIRAWWKKANNLLSKGNNVVCDDVRFENEAEFIRSKGGSIVLIERDGCEPTGHASERITFAPDFRIKNNGSIELLRDAVRHASSRFYFSDL